MFYQGAALTTWAALALSVPVAHAQASAALFEQLPVGQVSERDGYLYVRVTDQRRGTTQALDRILVNRATLIASQWLCNHTPNPQQRLEVSLQGVHTVFAQESPTGLMNVVVRFKKQAPACTVLAVAPSPAPTSTASPSVANPSTGAVQSRSVPPPEASADGFKTRVYSTEH